jgi:hypothetical protein
MSPSPLELVVSRHVNSALNDDLSHRHLAEEARRLKHANRKLRQEIRRLSAGERDGDEFVLSNPAPKPKPWQGDEPENTRQTVLLSGLDCLPGQQDLFAADGDG